MGSAVTKPAACLIATISLTKPILKKPPLPCGVRAESSGNEIVQCRHDKRRSLNLTGTVWAQQAGMNAHTELKNLSTKQVKSLAYLPGAGLEPARTLPGPRDFKFFQDRHQQASRHSNTQ